MVRLAAAAFAIVMMAGCSATSLLEPQKDPSEFFVLTPIDSAARSVPITYTAGGAKEMSIGLGPVKFPAYLAREEIVTRVSPNKVDLSNVNRWAEPIDKNFVSVLAQNLTVLTGAHLKTFPWYRPANLDYQIALDITRFDTDTHGTATITGRWDMEDPDNGNPLNSGEINITDAAQAGETNAATLSRALGDLSTQLADAVRATKHPAAHPSSD
ncbi:MAG TPA: PqiC family protein [Candidatus Binataceae bacterium]|nr:PqiC family protein [Candidatus Binataceae bacterium]